MNATKLQPLLPAALELYRLGMSVIPTIVGKKVGALKWQRFQTHRADEETLRFWFGDVDSGQQGIGIVLGDVSGGILVRDFDRQDAYETWKRKHRKLARILPTSKTYLGYHIYCRSVGYKADNQRTFCHRFDDGELRGDGHIVIAPPSIHSAGVEYQWIIPPESIPLIDLPEAGFEPVTLTRETQDTSCVSLTSLKAGLIDALPDLIERTLPKGPGERHRKIFEFARYLRNFSELTDAGPAQLEDFVREWHTAALAHIRTKDFDTTLRDFLEGWNRVRHPAGAGTLTGALQHAAMRPPPAEAEQFRSAKVRLLVGLCYELQCQHGDQPFFLSCRDAAEAIGLTGKERHVVAWRWLKMLCERGILKLRRRGDLLKKKASEFHYLPARH